ncbi:hypothetical protein F2P81_005175 [Scophthalmus maximus]|uniref:Uncharacterized protein n=1 Tax=Scophthalmus maximus TaxID=52904 RepID=A0A6A4T6K4_SCOMX|nr:hypothetical protein F2P81_005175 [Scophthalmus maximus]
MDFSLFPGGSSFLYGEIRLRVEHSNVSVSDERRSSRTLTFKGREVASEEAAPFLDFDQSDLLTFSESDLTRTTLHSSRGSETKRATRGNGHRNVLEREHGQIHTLPRFTVDESDAHEDSHPDAASS